MLAKYFGSEILFHAHLVTALIGHWIGVDVSYYLECLILDILLTIGLARNQRCAPGERNENVS